MIVTSSVLKSEPAAMKKLSVAGLGYTQSYNGQQVIEVNASELASGAYLIKMVSETSSEVQTLIVQ